jgi:hypothetical protein
LSISELSLFASIFALCSDHNLRQRLSNVWAGGYPIQANALRALNKKKKVLVTTLEERLHSLLDVGFSIDELNYRIGGYSAIFGLFPSDYPPNSLILQMSVNASSSNLNYIILKTSF